MSYRDVVEAGTLHYDPAKDQKPYAFQIVRLREDLWGLLGPDELVWHTSYTPAPMLTKLQRDYQRVVEAVR